jgi:hypothetical protein
MGVIISYFLCFAFFYWVGYMQCQAKFHERIQREVAKQLRRRIYEWQAAQNHWRNEGR